LIGYKNKKGRTFFKCKESCQKFRKLNFFETAGIRTSLENVLGNFPECGPWHTFYICWYGCYRECSMSERSMLQLLSAWRPMCLWTCCTLVCV